MKTLLRLAPVLVLAALIAGCEGPCQKLSPITAPATSVGTADFGVFAAVGTSISTGYQSGGVVDRHQVYAFPAIFARQVGKTVQLDGQGTFSQPTVNGNGSPALLHLVSPSPAVIAAYPTAGTATNTTYPRAYSDMAVPGALAYDFAHLTNYGGSAFLLVARGLGTVQDQMLSLNPTFISVEYGANEVLGPATSGSAVAPITSPLTPPAVWASIASPPAYISLMAAAMATIHSARPNAKVVMFNVPDVRSIPFFTTFPALTKDVRTGAVRGLRGWVHRGGVLQVDSLQLGELLTLKAQASLVAGLGFQAFTYNYLTGTVPTTNGAPLDSALVLDTEEQVVIARNVLSMNTSLDLGFYGNDWVAAVDLHGLLANLAANGYTLGGTHYSTEYVKGGLFSLDGVHPSDIGHAIIANAMIDAVNTKFHATVPHVDLSRFATATASSARPALGADDGLRGISIEGLESRLGALYGR